MRMIKKFGLVLCLSALSATLVTGCGNASNAPLAQEEAQTILVSVETETAAAGSIESYKVISSNITANNEISVLPKTSGTVTNLNVKVGDEVKAGDVLFEIDATDLSVQVESAKASVASAEATVKTAQAGINAALANESMNTGSSFDTQIASQKSNITNLEINYNDLVDKLDGYEELFDAGALPKTELDALRSQIATAKNQLDLAKESLAILEGQTIKETKQVSAASVEQAKANLSQAQASVAQSKTSLQNAMNQLAHAQVKAEVGGIVSSCSIAQGAMASQQSPALTIVDINTVKVNFNVTDELINQIHIGDKVYITVDSLTSQKFEGVISSIAPTANSQTLLYPVEINIKNTDHTLKPGMFATSQLVLGHKNNVISVPLNAVIEKDGEKYVYVVDDNQTVHKVIVQTGIENDTHIEIIAGLKEGDKVITKGQDYISEGSKVNIVASDQGTN